MSDRRLILLCASALIVLGLFGGAIVASGIAIGFLTATALGVLALKSKLIRGFARRYPLLADLLATGAGYLVFPAGVTAFVAAGVVALLITILISADRLANPGALPARETVTSRMAKTQAGDLPTSRRQRRSGVGDLLERMESR